MIVRARHAVSLFVAATLCLTRVAASAPPATTTATRPAPLSSGGTTLRWVDGYRDWVRPALSTSDSIATSTAAVIVRIQSADPERGFWVRSNYVGFRAEKRNAAFGATRGFALSNHSDAAPRFR